MEEKTGSVEKRILLVDDDKHFLDAMSFYLSRTMEVVKASSGESALEILKEQSIPVVISDMHMKGMTGVDFLTRAREFAPHSIFMLLTASREKSTAISAINDAGVFCIINKPCEMSELLEFSEAAFREYAKNH